MRLTSNEISGIKMAIEGFSSAGKIFLYGSRTNDALSGGDIDLLLVFNDSLLSENMNKIKYKVLVAIKDNIGEQRIDLSIISEDELSSYPFYSSVEKILL